MRAFTKFTQVLGICFVLILFLTACRHLETGQWPSIKAVSIRHHFAANKDSEQEKQIIYGRDGKPLYCLDARFCWRDYEIEDYNFSGVLDCRLYPLDRSSRYPTLLQNTVHATRDWESYGRFADLDVLAEIDDASRSVVQRCGVRGMIIEIEVFNVKADKENEGVESFDMIFRARNASSPEERSYAKGKIAAQDE